MPAHHSETEPSFGYLYYPNNNRIVAMDKISHYGLFSTFTLLLSTITCVHADFGVLPDKIDLRPALKKFKTNPHQDLYSTLFQQDRNIKINSVKKVGPDPHHTLYTADLIEGLNPYIRRYFNLSEEVKQIESNLTSKYSITSSDLLYVIYRGTDQFTDRGGFASVNCSVYERLARKIITPIREEERCVLIQSDEPRAIDYFKGLKGVYIDETSLGRIAPTGPPIPTTDVDMWLKYYISAIHIHGMSKHVITYTGNSGFWVALFKGNIDNLYQETTFSLAQKLFFSK